MHFDTPLTVIAAMSFSTFMWGTGAPNIFAAGEGDPSTGQRHGGRHFQRAGKLCGRCRRR
jgi:hypothetical protein